MVDSQGSDTVAAKAESMPEIPILSCGKFYQHGLHAFTTIRTGSRQIFTKPHGQPAES
ncbi:hypothetical protein [Noviherbaspirillum galbum]|uniref:Uncharacterized protein n=1 Tax=Noviherbaspirillum galbum TaxID=2709383 RepID=A0A6B3SGH6_9BURK|nr:hypothetical protein [Noviherbaspirillum galbum]NEX59730.1 hypothetical protein [Noviherbaspirillum galbum]